MIGKSIQMALRNIRGNRQRSFLTVLGILIGVAAVIAMITIVKGATDRTMKEFESLGTGMLQISTPGTSLKQGLTVSDIGTLESLPDVAGVSPSMSSETSAVAYGKVTENVTLDGEGSIYFDKNKKRLASGRMFNASESDGSVPVCLVDRKFADQVLGGRDPVGEKVLLAGVTYEIIGTLKKDDSAFSMVESSEGGTVYLPYQSLMTLTGHGTITSITVYFRDGVDTRAGEQAVRACLDGIYNHAPKSYSITDMESLKKTMKNTTDMLSAMLGGIAGISLLVGGIGIMNMMLVSVTERTREIGLRKALGAKPGQIQLQFLIESIVLSLTGGALGIAAGLLLAFLGSRLMQTDFVISGGAIALGAGFSVVIGVLFGWMPARRASCLNPIDALRAE